MLKKQKQILDKVAASDRLPLKDTGRRGRENQQLTRYTNTRTHHHDGGHPPPVTMATTLPACKGSNTERTMAVRSRRHTTVTLVPKGAIGKICVAYD